MSVAKTFDQLYITVKAVNDFYSDIEVTVYQFHLDQKVAYQSMILAAFPMVDYTIAAKAASFLADSLSNWEDVKVLLRDYIF